MSVLNGDPQQNDTERRLAQTIHEFAKVLILCQQDSIVSAGSLQDDLVDVSAQCLHGRNDVVTGCPQCTDQSSIATLVRKELHLRQSAKSKFVFREVVGGKLLRRPNVGHGEARMILNDLFHAHPAPQLAQNEFHGDTRSLYHRLAKHDLRIQFNSVMGFHVILLLRWCKSNPGLRFTFAFSYVLRFTFYVLRFTFYVLRFTFYV